MTKKRMKMRMILLLLLCSAFVLAGGALESSQAQVTYLTMGTGGTTWMMNNSEENCCAISAAAFRATKEGSLKSVGQRTFLTGNMGTSFFTFSLTQTPCFQTGAQAPRQERSVRSSFLSATPVLLAPGVFKRNGENSLCPGSGKKKNRSPDGQQSTNSQKEITKKHAEPSRIFNLVLF